MRSLKSITDSYFSFSHLIRFGLVGEFTLALSRQQRKARQYLGMYNS